MAQLVRAPPCHGGGHGFKSRLGRFVYQNDEMNLMSLWDLSSVGRASVLQTEGHRFEPYRSQLKEWRKPGAKIASRFCRIYKVNPDSASQNASSLRSDLGDLPTLRAGPFLNHMPMWLNWQSS